MVLPGESAGWQAGTRYMDDDPGHKETGLEKANNPINTRGSRSAYYHSSCDNDLTRSGWKAGLKYAG